VRTSLTLDQTKQRALPVWLLIVAALLIVARIVLSRYPAKAPVKADGDLVHWTEISQARGVAARSHRPILYEFSAAWCGPCHALERDVFMDPILAAKINSRYVAVKVVDTQREQGHNELEVQFLMDKYGVSAFPTIVIAAADGSVRDRVVGYTGPDSFAALIDNAR
jgi:thiol:disulfide interchange protein